MLLWSPSRAPFKNVFEKCFSKMFFKNVHFSLWGKNSATSTIIALILRILENCVLIHRLFYMYTSSTNFFLKVYLISRFWVGWPCSAFVVVVISLPCFNFFHCVFAAKLFSKELVIYTKQNILVLQ